MWEIFPDTTVDYLPYVLLLNGASTLINNAIGYVSEPTRGHLVSYPTDEKAPVSTSLIVHTYTFKNVYSAAIQIFAAYQIYNDPVYDLAILTFAGLLFFGVTEYAYFRTVQFKEIVLSCTGAIVGLVWMLLARSTYLDY